MSVAGYKTFERGSIFMWIYKKENSKGVRYEYTERLKHSVTYSRT